MGYKTPPPLKKINTFIPEISTTHSNFMGILSPLTLYLPIYYTFECCPVRIKSNKLSHVFARAGCHHFNSHFLFFLHFPPRNDINNYNLP